MKIIIRREPIQSFTKRDIEILKAMEERILSWLKENREILISDFTLEVWDEDESNGIQYHYENDKNGTLRIDFPLTKIKETITVYLKINENWEEIVKRKIEKRIEEIKVEIEKAEKMKKEYELLLSQKKENVEIITRGW